MCQGCSQTKKVVPTTTQSAFDTLPICQNSDSPHERVPSVGLQCWFRATRCALEEDLCLSDGGAVSPALATVWFWISRHSANKRGSCHIEEFQQGIPVLSANQFAPLTEIDARVVWCWCPGEWFHIQNIPLKRFNHPQVWLRRFQWFQVVATKDQMSNTSAR